MAATIQKYTEVYERDVTVYIPSCLYGHAQSQRWAPGQDDCSLSLSCWSTQAVQAALLLMWRPVEIWGFLPVCYAARVTI